MTSKPILQKGRSIGEISKSSLSLVFLTIMTKGIGYVEKIILAFYFGTTLNIDVYNIVYLALTNIFIFFREIIEPGFLNSFLKRIEAKDHEGAWRIFNSYFSYIILFTVSITSICMIYPESIIAVYSPGLPPEHKPITKQIVYLAMPSCIFLSLSSLTSITLNALKKFAIPASGELLLKVSAIITIVALYKYYGIGAAAAGILVGSVLKLALHLFFLRKYWSTKKLSLNTKYIKPTWSLTWPLIVGVLFSQLHNIVDSIFASYSDEGSITALSYAKRIIDFPIIILPYALSIVIFPYLSEYSIAKEKDKMQRLLSKSLFWVCSLFVPLTVVVYANAHEIVSFALKRGAFTEASVEITALPLKFYSFGLLFFALESIIVIFFFANANTKTPIAIGIFCALEGILLTVFFTKMFGFAGVALSLVVAKFTKSLILLIEMRKYVNIQKRKAAIFMTKLLLSAVAMSIAIFNIRSYFSELSYQNSYKIIYSSILPTAAGITIYLLLMFLLQRALRNNNAFRSIHRR